MRSLTNLEKYFEPYRNNIVGTNHIFQSCFGDKKLLYADWAATGRMYLPIENKLINSFGPLIGNTHSESNITGTTMTEGYNHSKKIIKTHVNANIDDVLIFSGYGMTSAINKFQRILGIKLHESLFNKISIKEYLKPLVLLTHMEHHSNHTSWLETISDVVVVPPGNDGLIDLNRFETVLNKYKNRKFKIGSFTACSNVTGIKTPYYELAKLMHINNGICLVDFSASAPYVKIDMHPKNPLEKLDGIFFSPHKFLGGPGSSGVLIFDSKLYSNKIPDQPGGGTVDWTNPWGIRKFTSNIEIREDGGTPGFMQGIRVALSIELKNKMGLENIFNRENEQLKTIFKNLSPIDGITIFQENIKSRIPIISFNIEGIHYNLIVQILNDKFGIQVRGGCACAGTFGHYLLGINSEQSNKILYKIINGDLSSKPGFVRISLHPTTSNEEIYYFINSLNEIIYNYKSFKNEYIYNKSKNHFKNINSCPNDNSKIIKMFEL